MVNSSHVTCDEFTVW